jgi:hypothetical protein
VTPLASTEWALCDAGALDVLACQTLPRFGREKSRTETLPRVALYQWQAATGLRKMSEGIALPRSWTISRTLKTAGISSLGNFVPAIVPASGRARRCRREGLPPCRRLDPATAEFAVEALWLPVRHRRSHHAAHAAVGATHRERRARRRRDGCGQGDGKPLADERTVLL